MEQWVPFSQVLLESHGWKLYRIDPPYRVFCKGGEPQSGLPILVEVHGKNVKADHLAEIIRILEKDQEA